MRSLYPLHELILSFPPTSGGSDTIPVSDHWLTSVCPHASMEPMRRVSVPPLPALPFLPGELDGGQQVWVVSSQDGVRLYDARGARPEGARLMRLVPEDAGDGVDLPQHVGPADRC